MPWIKAISYKEATGKLKRLYDRIKGPGGYLDNILIIHGLRPHTLEGHMTLYKHVLHHSANTVPKWFLETLGVYVSHLNGCSYCVDHHFMGLKRLVASDDRARTIFEGLVSEQFEPAFNHRERTVLRYAKELTRQPATMHQGLVKAMKVAGYTDGEILEINQVISYFAYANRTIQGLGVTTEGDVLGLSPGDASDSENWQHM